MNGKIALTSLQARRDKTVAKPQREASPPGRATAVGVADLWSRFSKELHTWLRARLNPPEMADDLLQEVFVRIARGLPHLRQPERPGPWVQRIARAVLVDHLRRRPNERALAGIEPAAPDATQSHADCHNEVVGRWLQKYLAALPAAYREAIELTEIQGMPQVELARLRGLSSSGSKSRVQRGRSLLRSALLDCCDLEIDRRGNVIAYRRRPACCPTAAGAS